MRKHLLLGIPRLENEFYSTSAKFPFCQFFVAILLYILQLLSCLGKPEKITPYLTFISFPDFKDYQSEIKFCLDFDSSIKNDDLLLLHFKNETYIFYKILIDDNFWHICKKASDLSESTREILFPRI